MSLMGRVLATIDWPKKKKNPPTLPCLAKFFLKIITNLTNKIKMPTTALSVDSQQDDKLIIKFAWIYMHSHSMYKLLQL